MRYSIILPIHIKDKVECFSECLRSLNEQTLPAGEVVVVEDGPISDDIEILLSRFERSLPIKRVKLRYNAGLATALNEGLNACNYSLVGRMDADDICFPERFRKQVEFFERFPTTDVLGTQAVEIGSDGHQGPVRSMPINHDEIIASLWTCPLLHPTVMFRREKILEIGGYDSSLRRRQDYELWFRCALHGLRFANMPESLLYYRFEPSSHKKQPPKLAFQQGMIGFRGASSLGLPAWKRLACFLPFARSLLPASLQHMVYTALRRFDPRQRSSRS